MKDRVVNIVDYKNCKKEICDKIKRDEVLFSKRVSSCLLYLTDTNYNLYTSFVLIVFSDSIYLVNVSNYNFRFKILLYKSERKGEEIYIPINFYSYGIRLKYFLFKFNRKRKKPFISVEDDFIIKEYKNPTYGSIVDILHRSTYQYEEEYEDILLEQNLNLIEG